MASPTVARLRVLVAAAVLLVAAVGCSSTIAGRPLEPDVVGMDRALILDYFERGNAAADEGATAQQEFFAKTQHPDFARQLCDLGGHTLVFDPTLSTLRPDDAWKPDDGQTPRGRIYVVAVTVTVELDQAVLGTQIGSMHLVVLDRATYGFSPCPN